MVSTCLQCSNEFITKRNKAKWCSENCRQKAKEIRYKDKYSIRRKLYKENNKKEEQKRNSNWYVKNKVHKDNMGREWSKNNLARKAFLRAKRRALKMNQTPQMTKEEWLKISDIYKKCRNITSDSGISHDVDHIVPLSKGGLHHPDNLQILTSLENRRKYNKSL